MWTCFREKAWEKLGILSVEGERSGQSQRPDEPLGSLDLRTLAATPQFLSAHGKAIACRPDNSPSPDSSG